MKIGVVSTKDFWKEMWNYEHQTNFNAVTTWLKKSSKKVKHTLVKSSQAGLCHWQYFASFPKSKDTFGQLFVNSIFLGKTNMEHSLSLVVLAVSLGAPSGILLSGSPTFEYNLHIVLHISFVVHQIWFYVFAIRDKWNDLLES